MNFFAKGREPINSFTHSLGAFLSFIGLILMIFKCVADNTEATTMASCVLFCISLILLYLASGVYHYSNGSEKMIGGLKKLDHSMIYILIAGSYTPILHYILPQPRSIYFISAIWVIGVLGVIFKFLWIDMPRWLCTALYIAMGWFVLLVPSGMFSLPVAAFWLLLLGGISYTLGGLIYGTKKPNFLGAFGFHEVFHIFILIGSLLHYIMIFIYIA